MKHDLPCLDAFIIGLCLSGYKIGSYVARLDEARLCLPGHQKNVLYVCLLSYIWTCYSSTCSASPDKWMSEGRASAHGRENICVLFPQFPSLQFTKFFSFSVDDLSVKTY